MCIKDSLGCREGYHLQCWSFDKESYKPDGAVSLCDRDTYKWELYGT